VNILINGEALDFTLEKEKTAGEVLNHIEDWLNSSDLFISEIFINQEEVYLHQKQDWLNLALEKIKTMDITALNPLEQRIKDLEILHNYFSLYIQALSENNEAILTGLSEEFDAIKESLPTALQLDPYVFDKQLFNLMEQSGLLSGNFNEEFRNPLLQEWQNTLQLLKGRLSELVDPLTEGKRTAETLINMKESLEEIPLLFQQGQDKKALDLIIVLSELLSRIFRIFSRLGDKILLKDKLKEYVDSMSEILRELSDAIQNQDTILMGDLVEYEILDRLDTLPTLFPEGNE